MRSDRVPAWVERNAERIIDAVHRVCRRQETGDRHEAAVREALLSDVPEENVDAALEDLASLAAARCGRSVLGEWREHGGVLKEVAERATRRGEGS